jgi:glycerophosphoryl diester phosphodiesterase
MDEKIKEELAEQDRPVSEEAPKKEKKQKDKTAVHTALHLLNYNFWSFFWFQILYQFATLCLIIPLMRKVVSLILYFSGISSVTNDNIIALLTHPATWIGLLVLLYMASAMISIEFSALCEAIHASDCRKKITVRDMLVFGIANCGSVFQPKNLMYLVYLLIIVPFTGIAEGPALTQSLTMPGFILEAINEKWFLQLLYYGGMLALMILSMRWIYIIPAMNIQKEDFRKASGESLTMTHKKLFKTILTLGICYLFMFCLIMILALGIFFGAFAIIHWLDPTINLVQCIEPVILSDIVIVYILFVIMTQPLVLSRIYVDYKQILKKDGIVLPLYQKPTSLLTKYRPVRIILYLCAAVGIYFFVPPRYQEMKLIMNNASSETMVMAHRGDSVHAPENTLPAFQAAIDYGADAAEMDVQMTKDGTIVVLHDSSIDRTSTGTGNIWDVTYHDIENLDNGSFFDASFADTRIPTLDQVIKLCKGKLFLNIEIKRTGHDDGIEQKVIDIIKDNNFQEQCDITSMDYNTLVTVKSIDPSIETVYTTNVALGNVEDMAAADAFSIEGTFVTQSFVRQLRQNGKKFYVWTVNDEEQMQKMINLGANAIITNDPSACRELVASDSQKGVFGVLQKLRTGLLGK